MDKPGKICVAAIVGVHGIRGEVKLKSFTADPMDADGYGALEDASGKSYAIKITGHSKQLLRAKVKGIDDRNAAEALVGTELWADRSVLPELGDEEEFYYQDLIGLEVRLAGTNAKIGAVAGVYNFGSGDIVEIKLAADGKTEMLPFAKAYVPVVDIDNGYIIVAETSLVFAKEDTDEG